MRSSIIYDTATFLFPRIHIWGISQAERKTKTRDSRTFIQLRSKLGIFFLADLHKSPSHF